VHNIEKGAKEYMLMKVYRLRRGIRCGPVPRRNESIHMGFNRNWYLHRH
jgi:hypothetical protein